MLWTTQTKRVHWFPQSPTIVRITSCWHEDNTHAAPGDGEEDNDNIISTFTTTKLRSSYYLLFFLLI